MASRLGARGALGLVVVVVVLTIGILSLLNDDRGWTTGPAFDPRSTEPAGLRGLVLLMEESGYDVRTAPVPPRGFGGVVVGVSIEIDTERARLLRAAARDGATVIMAGSILPGFGSDPIDQLRSSVDPELCEFVSLAAVREIAVVLDTYEVRDGDQACLTDEAGVAAAVLTPVGEGAVLHFGGVDALTNGNLADADHAAMALGVIAANGGADGEVVVLDRRVAGSGDSSLLDLVPTAVRLGLVQLLIIAIVEMARRSRRLGRPVIEDDPVEFDGSETVRGTGRLLTRVGDRGDALAVLTEGPEGGAAAAGPSRSAPANDKEFVQAAARPSDGDTSTPQEAPPR